MSPLTKLFQHARRYRARAIIASVYSVLNKTFDVLPEVLIGIAVDVIVSKQDSFLARLGVVDGEAQLAWLGVL
ncbi:MAG TPA: hypothetical protein VLS89_17565, partial [Candidatus Nanopelagicales bacterium]|nr:hypothetical protein [Candidatus Nanopelagicales bacterium]